MNRDGSVDTFEIGKSEDDCAATRQARSAMLVSQTAVAVEIWRDGSRVCRIGRDGAAPRAASAFASLGSAGGDHRTGATAFYRPAGDDRRPTARAASA
ncbi:MAG TPA: hypothetical protein VL460_03805 [Caulobacteraceae bacterium]|nr:hypothetical protein [Caulobacteraceae bacterium]